MRIRLQYSLLTLLVLTAICGVVLAFVVIPWRHDREQSELIERFRNHESGDFYLSEVFDDKYGVAQRKDNSYEFQYWGNESQGLEEFLEHAANCELVNAVKLTHDNFTTEQLAKLQRLPRLERLSLETVFIDEERMRVCAASPLQVLLLEPDGPFSFETWPIQPELKSLTLHVEHTFEFPPLKIFGHRKLQELDLQGLRRFLSLENCPELKELKLKNTFEGNPIELRLRNLPKLERLSLDDTPLLPESRIEELPALRELDVCPTAFEFLRPLQLNKLQVLSIPIGWQLDRAAVERALSLPELQKLSLEADWQDCADNKISFPPLPKLKELCLYGNYGNKKRHFPDQLLIQFLGQTPALEVLVLYLENASDEVLQAIVRLENLETLYLRLGEHGTHGDLSVLLKSKKLHSFSLNGKPGWPAAQASP